MSKKKNPANVTVEDLEKALSGLGKLAGVDVEENFLSKAMSGEEGDEPEEGDEAESTEKEAPKTPPPPAKKAPKKEPEEKEDEDEEEDEDSDSEDDEGGDDEYGAEDEEEGEDEGTEAGADFPPAKKSLRKGKSQTSPNTLSKAFSTSDEINDAVDVSPFLDAMVTRLTDTVGKLETRLRKSMDREVQYQRATAQVLVPMAKLLKSINDRQRRTDEVIAKLSGQPQARRSVSSATVVERALGNAAPQGAPAQTIAKSMNADGSAVNFTSPQDLLAHITDRISKSVNGAEVDRLSALVTQVETRTVNKELAQQCGYTL